MLVELHLASNGSPVWISPEIVESLAPHKGGEGCVVEVGGGETLTVLEKAEEVARMMKGGEKPRPAYDLSASETCAHHVPDEGQIRKIAKVREAAAALLDTIREVVPAGADRAAAERWVRTALFTANAGIVLKGKL